MKRRIQGAYDSIRLSETSKEKIWEDIMDSQRKGYRAVLKRGRSQKWRAIPAALAIVALIAVGAVLGIRGLGDRDTPMVAADPTGNILTAPVDPTDRIYSNDMIDYEQEFADVPEYLRDHVIMYAQALCENWPREDWERFGLNLELYQVKDHVVCGFVLKDLDDDGLEELLIYGGEQLYEILVVNFWPVDTAMGLPAHTLWCLTCEENESRMFLCEDNVIMITYVLNDGDEYIDYRRLGKNSSGLSCLETIETVFAIDGTEWFAGANYKDAVPISAEEADNIRGGYKLEEVEPSLIPNLILTNANLEYLYENMFELDGVDQRYHPLFMNYGRALFEDWSQVQWEEAGLSLEVYQKQDKYWILEYTLLDMDGNGVDELLILDDDQLYALYVLRDDVPDERLEWTIHHNAERLSIQLCENNIIKVVQKDPTGATDTSFYRVGKDGVGDISLVMVYSALETPEGKWYAGPNAKDAVEVTEKEALAMIESFLPMDIDATPIGNNLRLD